MIIKRQKFVDDRRSDVVRKIAGDHGWSPLREIGSEHIALMHVQLGLASKLRSQILRQRRIELDDVQLIRSWQKMAGESAAAGTDLDDARRVLTARRICQGFEYGIAD